jgi:ABC-2 type transport system ATP-binding protein
LLTVSHLTKRYGDFLAVDDVSLDAPPGAIFGLLGPNGAGKSTIIGCISGLLKPGAGSVSVAGFDTANHPREAKAALGVVPQELALYEDLTARENLLYWGGAYGLRGAELAQRADALLRRIALADRPKDQVKKFSGGMKRRLNFACALRHRPTVLLLDEPTVGVDPQTREALLDLYGEEVQQGT